MSFRVSTNTREEEILQTPLPSSLHRPRLTSSQTLRSSGIRTNVPAPTYMKSGFRGIPRQIAALRRKIVHLPPTFVKTCRLCVYTHEPNRCCNPWRTCWDGVICALRAVREPLANRSSRSAWSRFFRQTQRDDQFKLGRVLGRVVRVYVAREPLLNQSMAQWVEEDIVQLIQRRKPLKKNFKEDAWRDIGSAMGRLIEERRNKIVCLLSSYRRKKSNESKTKGTGKGASDVYKSKWFAFEELRFLEDRDAPKKRLNTVTKVKGHSPETRKAVKHAVFDILMKADTGYYEQPAGNFPFGYQHPYSADINNIVPHHSPTVFDSTRWLGSQRDREPKNRLLFHNRQAPNNTKLCRYKIPSATRAVQGRVNTETEKKWILCGWSCGEMEMDEQTGAPEYTSSPSALTHSRFHLSGFTSFHPFAPRIPPLPASSRGPYMTSFPHSARWPPPRLLAAGTRRFFSRGEGGTVTLSRPSHCQSSTGFPEEVERQGSERVSPGGGGRGVPPPTALGHV
ncbi:hypothetical protein PR048_020255 [Dryococelus australis]|uniref:MADF domain-containing protein n=1 Tax=Dryococelus australis TaxID=614101 RepID=A0ABQ9H5S7_9NEOP|nr:hypothetical protein PR048_020255 [Dryococelus australis]